MENIEFTPVVDEMHVEEDGYDMCQSCRDMHDDTPWASCTAVCDEEWAEDPKEDVTFTSDSWVCDPRKYIGCPEPELVTDEIPF